MAGRNRNNNKKLATTSARGFVVLAGLVVVLVVVAMAQGVHSATTTIINDLPADCSFVMYDDTTVLFPTRTAHVGQQVGWTYDISRSQWYRVSIRAQEHNRGLMAQIQPWSRKDWAGILDPQTLWKLNDTGLYAQNTLVPNNIGVWHWVGPWSLL